MFAKNRLTKEQALEKIKHYCGYQERCHQEVKDKLYGYGLHKKEVEEILSNIIENNYLNEERFAIQYAGGKFRMKQWGRRKIQFEMQQKGISAYLIKFALKEIDQGQYAACLRKLAEAKWKTLAKEHYLTRQSKTTNYLLQKGYEPALVSKVVNELRTGNQTL